MAEDLAVSFPVLDIRTENDSFPPFNPASNPSSQPGSALLGTLLVGCQLATSITNCHQAFDHLYHDD